jgi:hypothetical protein
VGDNDNLVAGQRQLADRLNGLNFHDEYKPLSRLDQGGVIGGSMPDAFKFFNQHAKSR